MSIDRLLSWAGLLLSLFLTAWVAVPVEFSPPRAEKGPVLWAGAVEHQH